MMNSIKRFLQNKNFQRFAIWAAPLAVTWLLGRLNRGTGSTKKKR